MVSIVRSALALVLLAESAGKHYIFLRSLGDCGTLGGVHKRKTSENAESTSCVRGIVMRYPVYSRLLNTMI